MTDYVPNEGDVSIELAGEGKTWLKPTIGACLRVSGSEFGEPRELADKVSGLNFPAICYVVAAGLGRPVDDKLEEIVFRTGTMTIFGACLRFLYSVSNGGRPPKAGAEEVVDTSPLPST